ncbi:sodium-independent sulfate anion transporter-like [Patiria miniata]|uniref:STAS domain-containing protein n=1 Tax=Patiria miniata TaxID=46514 RepID=A0A914AUF8_PATMI|nr:sodium-independent sulfate anion transporter-like [Patiria miniata]
MAQCGARTPLANLVTGSIVLLAIAFLTPAFYYIPKAALAAVIISALLKLVDPAAVKTFWKVRKLDLIPYTFTFIGSLVLGLQYGVVIGVALDLVILIYPVARPNIEFVKPSLLTAGIECSSSKSDNPAMVVRVQGSMRYPSSRYIVDSITKQCLHGDFCRPVILDFTFAKEMDTTAIEDLYDILDAFKKENVRIVMACVKDNIKCQLVAAEIPGLTVFTSIEDARLGLQEMETESSG